MRKQSILQVFKLPSVTNVLSLLRLTTIDMADDGVATKAPESDVHEPSMLSKEDTPAQQGASMGVPHKPLHLGIISGVDLGYRIIA